MNRTIVTAVLLLLCICATSTNAVKMDARLSDILNSKMQAIHALGAEPCVPLKDPCTYGKEIGEQLSRMAQQIVTQNGLQAQQGRQIITEWINHIKTKCADKKCAQEAFEAEFTKFGANSPSEPRNRRSTNVDLVIKTKETLYKLKDLEHRLEVQVGGSGKYRNQQEREKLETQLKLADSPAEKARLQKESAKTMGDVRISKKASQSDVHLQKYQLKVGKCKEHLKRLQQVMLQQTEASNKEAIKQKINLVNARLVLLRRKEKILMRRSLREHHLKVKALKNQVQLAQSLSEVLFEENAPAEKKKSHKKGCTPGHYISTSEIRERIKQSQRELLLKGRTCGFKQNVLKKMITGYEEILQKEWKNIHSIEEEMRNTDECEQLVCLKKRQISHQEAVFEAKSRIYELKQRLDNHKLHDLQASASVSKELISELHQRLNHASDSEMIEMRASLNQEVDNLKHANRQICKIEAHQVHLLELMEHKRRVLDKKVKHLQHEAHNIKDTCQKRILDLDLRSVRHRVEVHHVQIKKITTIKRVQQIKKKEAILKKRLLKAKSHTKRIKIREQLHKVQLKKSIVKKKLVHIKQLHKLHKKTLVVKKLNKKISILKHRIEHTTDTKKKAALTKKLNKAEKRIKLEKKIVKSIRKKIVKIRKVIKKTTRVSTKTTKTTKTHIDTSSINKHSRKLRPVDGNRAKQDKPVVKTKPKAKKDKQTKKPPSNKVKTSQKPPSAKEISSRKPAVVKDKETKQPSVVARPAPVKPKTVVNKDILTKNHPGKKETTNKTDPPVRQLSIVGKNEPQHDSTHSETTVTTIKRRVIRRKKTITRHTVRRVKKTRRIIRKTRKVIRRTRKVTRKVSKVTKKHTKVTKNSSKVTTKKTRKVSKRIRRVTKKTNKTVNKKKTNFKRKLRHGNRRKIYEHQIREKTKLEFRKKRIVRKRKIVRRVTKRIVQIQRKQRKFVNKRRRFDEDDSQGNKILHPVKDIGHHGEAKKVDGDFTKTNDKITIKFFKETHKNASGKKQKKQHKKAKRFASKRDSIDGEANPSKLASSRAKPAGPGSSPAASQPATKARVRTFKQGHKALALAQSDSDDLEDSLDSAILMV